MNKYGAILYDTFLEIKSGKIIYLYGLVSFVLIVVLALAPAVAIDGQDLLSQDLIPEHMLVQGLGYFFQGFLEFYVLLMLFGTAWLIPSYLSKGRIEIALSKPISRPVLCISKFASIFLVMSSILAIGTIPVWLIVSIRLDHFAFGFFGALIYGMFDFMLLFALVYAVGIFTRSGSFSLIGYFALKVGCGLLASRETVYPFIEDSLWKPVLDAMYHILPKYSQFSDNYFPLIAEWNITDYYAIWTTALFTLALFAGAVYYFSRKDF